MTDIPKISINDKEQPFLLPAQALTGWMKTIGLTCWQ